MDDSKISVIIPIYNGIDYIDECVKSILNQTYNNYEIILVDDCSQDDSYLICKQYAKEYPKIIKAFKKDINTGIAESLNWGMKESSGDYYFIISQDDTVATDAFEKANEKIKQNGADIILLNRKSIVDSSGKIVTYPNMPDELLGELEYEKKKKAMVHLVSVAAFVMIGFFKKEFVDNNALFYDDVSPEDISIFPIMIAEAASIDEIRDSYYIYKIHDDSISHRKNSPLYLTIHEAALKLLDNAKEKNIYDLYKEEFDYAFVVAFYYDSVFNQIARFDHRDMNLLCELRDYMKNNFNDYLSNKYVMDEMEEWKRNLMKKNDEDPYGLVLEFPNCDEFLNMVRSGEIQKKLL